MVGCCEHGSEPQGAIKSRLAFDFLRQTAAWSWCNYIMTVKTVFIIDKFMLLVP